jgi:hypothetical protein
MTSAARGDGGRIEVVQSSLDLLLLMPERAQWTILLTYLYANMNCSDAIRGEVINALQQKYYHSH